MKTVSLFIMLILSAPAFTQADGTFQEMLDELVMLDELYAALDLGDNIEIDSLKLPEAKLEFISHSMISFQLDQLESDLFIEWMQMWIYASIRKVVFHPQFHVHDIIATLNRRSIYVLESCDRQLYNFSYSEKSGGSYQSNISITVYFDEIDSVFYPVYYNSQQHEQEDIFHSDGYDHILCLPSPEYGTMYLMIGGIISCGSCYHQYANLVRFENKMPVQAFTHSILNRFGMGELFLEDEGLILGFLYGTDDLTPECDCTDLTQTVEDLLAEEFDGKVCQCKFRFTGSTYEVVE